MLRFTLIVTSILLAVSSLAGEPQVTVHRAPKPYPAGAVTADWPRFLGPLHNCTTPETKLLHAWGEKGPSRGWEFEKGLGHGSPAVADERVVILHRWEGRERIDCLAAETGQPIWKFNYEAPYRDRMGSGDGPRTSPVIADGRVFTYGVTGRLHCLDAATGKLVWQLDCAKEFDLVPNFFGHGSTPLVMGNRLIVQLGGKDDLCAAAFDVATGKLLWKARHEWGASYGSPVPATLHGRACVLILAGGETRPPTGGLLCIDAATGEVLSATPHRAAMAESVNASSPVVAGNRVFVTEAYGTGGAMIEIAPDFSARKAWQGGAGAHFMTPLVHDGCIVGCDGQSPRLAELVCNEIATGKELWRNDLGGKFGRTNLIAAEGAALVLGEFGDLAWLELSRAGPKVLQQAKLFHAPESWSLPALSRGLLYVCQNERTQDGKTARVICYDLRAE